MSSDENNTRESTYKFNDSSAGETLFQQLIKRNKFQNIVTAILILIAFFGLIPMYDNLGLKLYIIKNIFFSGFLFLVIYMYFKTVSEIRIGTEEIKIRGLKAWEKIPLFRVEKIYISDLSLSGISFLWFKDVNKTHFFMVLAPSFQKDIHKERVDLLKELRKFSFTKSI